MEPKLTAIFGRWAASVDGWAVFGDSKEQAAERFRKAERQACGNEPPEDQSGRHMAPEPARSQQ